MEEQRNIKERVTRGPYIKEIVEQEDGNEIAIYRATRPALRSIDSVFPALRGGE